MSAPGVRNEALAAAARELSLPAMRAALEAGADPAAEVGPEGWETSIAEVVVTAPCEQASEDAAALDAPDARRVAALQLLREFGLSVTPFQATTLLHRAVSGACGGRVVEYLIAAGGNPRHAAPLLLHVVERGAAATALIAAGADPLVHDEDGFPCLMGGVPARRRPSVVKALVDGGADVDARDRNGWTALIAAASLMMCTTAATAPAPTYAVDAVTALLDVGADPTIPNEQGVTPLQMAAAEHAACDHDDDGSRGVLLRITHLLASAEAWWRRRHMLLAVRGRHCGVAGAAASADVPVPAAAGAAPATGASSSGATASLQVVECADNVPLQARLPASLQAALNSALTRAAPGATVGALRRALEAGVDSTTTARLLHDTAELALASEYTSWKAHTPAQRDESDGRGIAAMQQLRGAGMVLTTQSATRLLCVAAGGGCGGRMVADLLAAGADVHDADALPLHYAQRGATARALIAAGASANAVSSRGDTCLTVSTLLPRRLSFIQAVAEAGADIDARNTEGSTALAVAAEDIGRGSSTAFAAFDALLQLGADPTVADATGTLPLDLVKEELAMCCDGLQWRAVTYLMAAVRLLVRAAAWRQRRHLLLLLRARYTATGSGGAGSAAPEEARAHDGAVTASASGTDTA